MRTTSVCLFFGLAGFVGITVLARAEEAVRDPRPTITVIIDEAPPELRGATPRLWAAVLSPDANTLATTAGWDDPKEPGELVLWDVATRREKLIRRQEATIRTVAFSGDGKLLAIGDFAGRTSLLDPATGKIVATLPRHAKTVNSVVFTPDDKMLAIGSFDGTISLWDIAAGKEQLAFSLPDEMVVKIAISSDAHRLAAVTWQGKAYLWDLPKREKLHSLQASQGPAIAEAVAFAPDGKSIVTGSWDKTVRLWNTATGEPIRDLIGHTSAVQNAAFSPDGKTLATSDARGKVLLWSPDTGERLGVLEAHTDRCFGLAFSSDGKRLATAGWDRIAKIWNLETRTEIATFTRAHP